MLSLWPTLFFSNLPIHSLATPIAKSAHFGSAKNTKMGGNDSGLGNHFREMSGGQTGKVVSDTNSEGGNPTLAGGGE